MTKPASKPRSWRVWVRPDPADELRRFGNVLGYKNQYGKPGEGLSVRATLTLDPPQRAPKRKEAMTAAPADAMPLETGPQLLQRLGMDAAKWCAEMAARGVVRADPAPGEIFHAWMCNAIMTAYDIGSSAGERRTETERMLPLLKQSLQLACPWMRPLVQQQSPVEWEKWAEAVDTICGIIDHLSPKSETKS